MLMRCTHNQLHSPCATPALSSAGSSWNVLHYGQPHSAKPLAYCMPACHSHPPTRLQPPHPLHACAASWKCSSAAASWRLPGQVCLWARCNSGLFMFWHLAGGCSLQGAGITSWRGTLMLLLLGQQQLQQRLQQRLTTIPCGQRRSLADAAAVRQHMKKGSGRALLTCWQCAVGRRC